MTKVVEEELNDTLPLDEHFPKINFCHQYIPSTGLCFVTKGGDGYKENGTGTSFLLSFNRSVQGNV